MRILLHHISLILHIGMVSLLVHINRLLLLKNWICLLCFEEILSNLVFRSVTFHIFLDLLLNGKLFFFLKLLDFFGITLLLSDIELDVEEANYASLLG